MPMPETPNDDDAGPLLLSMQQLSDPMELGRVGPKLAPIYRAVTEWIRTYLMRPHSELGRPGDVCPFTSQAFRLDTIRIGVSPASSSDIASIRRSLRHCFRKFALIPCPKHMQHFRTVVLAFPALEGTAGLETMQRAQRGLNVECLARGLMLAKFHPAAEGGGLWSPAFQPFRSPVPLLVIRQMVKEDAPFALRHPLLLIAYVWKYTWAAPTRLLAALNRGKLL